MLSFTDVSKLLATRTAGRCKISSQTFSEIEYLLEERAFKFTYIPNTSLFKFQMPTLIHSSVTSWLSNWVIGLSFAGHLKPCVAEIYPEASLANFRDFYMGSRKTPDAAVFLQGRKWPTIALEVGYSEPYDELLEDADLLLEGSEGRIGIVIVVKLQPLGSGDTAIGSGFVELHKFNESTQKRIRLGGRRRLYPPPTNRSQQVVRLTWQQFLREKIQEHVSESDEQPPPLRLEGLREAVNRSVARQLAFTNNASLVQGQTDDSEK